MFRRREPSRHQFIDGKPGPLRPVLERLQDHGRIHLPAEILPDDPWIRRALVPFDFVCQFRRDVPSHRSDARDVIGVVECLVDQSFGCDHLGVDNPIVILFAPVTRFLVCFPRAICNKAIELARYRNQLLARVVPVFIKGPLEGRDVLIRRRGPDAITVPIAGAAKQDFGERLIIDVLALIRSSPCPCIALEWHAEIAARRLRRDEFPHSPIVEMYLVLG